MAEACRAHSSRIKSVPLMAAATRPAVVLAGRPTTERASDARAGRVEASLLIKLASRDNRLVMREGAHTPLLSASSDTRGCVRTSALEASSLFVLYTPERQVDAWLNHAPFLRHFMR